jgi:hypothetical protein
VGGGRPQPVPRQTLEIACKFGAVPEDLEIVRAYSLCDPDPLATALKKAGFADVTVERVAVPRWFGEPADRMIEGEKHPAEYPR